MVRGEIVPFSKTMSTGSSAAICSGGAAFVALLHATLNQTEGLDASGNPLPDVFTNANDPTRLRIPCTTVHSAGSQFDGCPDHLATATGAGNPIAGQRAVSFDVAAWADLWFYSNPIYIEVAGSTVVAGVQ